MFTCGFVRSYLLFAIAVDLSSCLHPNRGFRTEHCRNKNSHRLKSKKTETSVWSQWSSTPHFNCFIANDRLERVAGIEPAYSAWKAAALPLSYTRALTPAPVNGGGGWIRTNVAYATDLQSVPFNHSGTPPLKIPSGVAR